MGQLQYTQRTEARAFHIKNTGPGRERELPDFFLLPLTLWMMPAVGHSLVLASDKDHWLV